MKHQFSPRLIGLNETQNERMNSKKKLTDQKCELPLEHFPN